MAGVNVTLTAQVIDRVASGLTPSYTGAGASPLLNVDDTFKFRNTGREFLHFKKSGAGVCVVTFKTPGQIEGLDIAELIATVPASTGDIMVGPFPPEVFNTAGSIYMEGFTLSEVTGLSVAVLQLPLP